MPEVVVDVEELEKINSRLEEINKVPFQNIRWKRDGKDLVLNHDVVDEWKYIGLSNSSFVSMGFHNLPGSYQQNQTEEV